MTQKPSKLRQSAYALALLPVLVHGALEIIPFGIAGDVFISENAFPLTVWWDWLPLRPDSVAYGLFFPSLFGASILIGVSSGESDSWTSGRCFVSAASVVFIAFFVDWFIAAGFYPIYTPDPFDMRYPILLSSLGGRLFYDNALAYGLLLACATSVVCGCVAGSVARFADLAGVGWSSFAALTSWLVAGCCGMSPIIVLQPYLAIELSSSQIVLSIFFAGMCFLTLASSAMLLRKFVWGRGRGRYQTGRFR